MGFSMTKLENEVLWQSYLLLGDNTNSFKDGMKNEWVSMIKSSRTILLQSYYIPLGEKTNGFFYQFV
jgi:hypothetical protein